MCEILMCAMRFNYRIENHTKLNPIHWISSANPNFCCKHYVLMWNIPSNALWIHCNGFFLFSKNKMEALLRNRSYAHSTPIPIRMCVRPNKNLKSMRIQCKNPQNWSRLPFADHSTSESRLGWRVFSKPAGIRCVQCVPRLHFHFSLAYKTHFERVQYSLSSFSHFPRVQVEKKKKKLNYNSNVDALLSSSAASMWCVCVRACDLRAVLFSCILHTTTRFIVNTW